MRQTAVFLAAALFACSLLAAETTPSLPSWFPAPAGRYEVNQLTYRAYDEFNLRSDHPLPGIAKNSGGYWLVHGKTWQFELKNPKPDAWTSTAEQLLAQGFKFIHGDMKSVKGSSAFMKGEGEHAIYVAFWQCCNSAAIIETAPNPFHITLKAPAQTAEAYTDKEIVPWMPPIDGGKYESGNHSTQRLYYTPGCTGGKSEVFALEHDWRRYQGPSNISDYAVRETYKSALVAAGWENLCEGGSHSLKAQYTKNGRNLLVNLTPHVFGSHFTYEIQVADAASGFRSELKKNCKASLYGVNFDFDKATLRPDAEPALNQLLSVLKDEPKLVVEIGGHTDNVGKPDYNLKLSDERAAAVRQWLVARGIAAPRLTSHGYGDTQPLVPNSTDENRARNRRVEVIRTDCK